LTGTGGAQSVKEPGGTGHRGLMGKNLLGAIGRPDRQ